MYVGLEIVGHSSVIQTIANSDAHSRVGVLTRLSLGHKRQSGNYVTDFFLSSPGYVRVHSMKKVCEI